MNPEPKKQKTASISNNGAIVQLNVGGQYFSTTQATLLQSSSNYFSRLLEQDEELSVTGALRDEQGRLFIDRDPTLFSHILDYLRNLDHFSVDSLSLQQREKLQKEALYYQLDGLVTMTRPPCTGFDETCLSEADQAIRQEAQYARANLLEGTGSAKADELLIDVFATRTVNGQERLPLETLFDQPASSPQAYCLFDKRVERARQERPPNPPASVEEFKERLVQFGGPLLQNFPMKNVVIAGGAVLSCLQGVVDPDDDTTSDVDVFLVADTPEQARAVFDGIVAHLSTRNVEQAIGHDELLVTRSPFAVTFCVGKPQRHIQLILIRRQCIADVILNFDIDCCQVAWDGNRVLATPSALRALQTGINIADPDRASGEYEWRLAKYAMRGFLVAVPGLDVNKVKEKYIRNSCFGYHQGHLKRIHLNFTGKDRPEYRIEEDSIVQGLALLLVLSTTYYHGFEERAERTNQESRLNFHRRLQQAEARLGLSAVGSLGMGNYLLDYAKMERYEHFGTWKLSTPPAPPPANILRDISHVRWVDTAGTEILPLNQKPSKVFRILNGRPQCNMLYEPNGKSSMMDDIHQKRLICYDLLPSDRTSNETPNVLDASKQYPSYPFPSGRGRLTRFLEFPSSTDVNAIPWTSGLSAEEWTRGVYESSQ